MAHLTDRLAQAAQAKSPLDDKVSALRSALRSAPPKRRGPAHGSLKAAVMQLLPDLLAFRAKGYSDAELADIMRDNGFRIAASTLKKYIGSARTESGKARKKKPAPVKSKARIYKPNPANGPEGERSAGRPSLPAPKPSAPNRKAVAKDVLGHRFDEDV